MNQHSTSRPHGYNTTWFSSSRYDNANFTSPSFGYYDYENYSTFRSITESALELSNNFRELWEQHSAWTRMTIISMVFDLPDVALVTNRLLQNPVDFGKALKVFYGDKIALTFSDLLREHLVIAAQIITAAKEGDNKTVAILEKRWYANADEIANLLASINPYWTKEVWQIMLYNHLELVKSEVVSMLSKNYGVGIKVYDEIESQALEMADMMTEGIIKQFPDRF